jgi:hypothetical protein
MTVCFLFMFFPFLALRFYARGLEPLYECEFVFPARCRVWGINIPISFV